MATYRRHGAGWQAQIIRKGYPARYRTFDTVDAAKKWAVQIEADMSRGVSFGSKSISKLDFNPAA